MTVTVWHTTMSLDGFIAGPDDALEWTSELGQSSDLADGVKEGTGAILAGRRRYDVATERDDGRARIYGGSGALDGRPGADDSRGPGDQVSARYRLRR